MYTGEKGVMRKEVFVQLSKDIFEMTEKDANRLYYQGLADGANKNFIRFGSFPFITLSL